MAEAETERERKFLTSLTENLCTYFAKENPRFDAARFRKACDPYDTGGETC
jgi:hypothetical protein